MFTVYGHTQQIKDGFKGFEWDTDILAMKDTFGLYLTDSLTQLSDTSNYEKDYSTNINKIGSAAVICEFTFYKNKFYSVCLRAEGYDNFKKLKAAMDEAYEKGGQLNPYIDKYYYNKVGTITSRVLEYSKINNRTTILMWSRKILEEKKKDDKEKAKKDKNDF